MKNEKTSKIVAKVAGRILNIFKQNDVPDNNEILTREPDSDLYLILGKAGELKALAASALTQAPDKKKAKKVGRR